MKKSNVTKIRESRSGRQPALAGGRPDLPSDSEIIGWLIYRSDTEEFLYSHCAGIGYSAAAYVKEPAFAYLFSSEHLAFKYSTFIDHETEVVSLFDIGDKLVVGFS